MIVDINSLGHTFVKTKALYAGGYFRYKCIVCHFIIHLTKEEIKTMIVERNVSNNDYYSQSCQNNILNNII